MTYIVIEGWTKSNTLHSMLPYGNLKLHRQYYLLIIIIIKKDWQCKAGRARLTPYQSEDPSTTLPTYRGKEEKGKIVKDKKRERATRSTKRHWTCS